jgi:DNA-binding NtrC family response regulator
MARRILLVDDDSSLLRSLSEALRDFGAEVETAGSAEGALSRLSSGPVDVILTDIRMPGLDGVELLEQVRQRMPSTDVILMTAYDDMPTVVRAMRAGAFDFLVKPINLDEMEEVLRRALDDHRTRERVHRATEDAARPYRLDELVGRGPQMVGVFKLVGQLATSRVNVLVRGESGTGKEIVARAIHFNSPAAAEPFVPVNCTALPESLLESELFGHVRGAFTGAVSDRRGRFALAGHGTVFLDEIGDTAPAFQAKLLRVLEGGEFFPVGGERPERTDARIIAATHQDLEALTEHGRFRRDLYYRLRVVEITLPPLRERASDIPPLARHLARKASDRLHMREPALPDTTVEVLLTHDWPGNVRELENCITRAVALATGGVIRAEHLGIVPADGARADTFQSLDAVESAHVQRVLRGVSGNKARAARILGISKPRLYRLLQKHRIDGEH